MDTNANREPRPQRRGQIAGDPWAPRYPWDDHGQTGHADDLPCPTILELDRITEAARLGGGEGASQ